MTRVVAGRPGTGLVTGCVESSDSESATRSASWVMAEGGRDFVWVVATGRPRSQGDGFLVRDRDLELGAGGADAASSITRPEPGGRTPLIGAARSVADGERSPRPTASSPPGWTDLLGPAHLSWEDR